MKATLVVLLFLFSSLCVAGTRDPRTEDSKHVAYGAKFGCVAKLSCKEPETGGRATASCVIIAPHWVVTAAHVVAGGSDFRVDVDGESFPLTRVISHEGYRGNSLDGNDIALGYSARDFALSGYPGLYSGSGEAGAIVSLSGYGVIGTFEAGYQTSLADGKRRAGSNTVDCVTLSGLLVCSASTLRRTELEFLISPGDSGGGLFIGDDLAGVNSCLMTEKARPRGVFGDESGHTRISKHREWIRDRITPAF